MSTAVVSGSIGAIANRDRRSLAKVFMESTDIILIDTSGSMKERDSTGGQSRYDVACHELRRLQRDMPGRLTIFAFSDECVLVPGGIPPFLNGGTDLLSAIQHVMGADGTVTFTVISDGYPDPGTDFEIIQLVSQMESTVNAIFAGPVEDDDGRKFMSQLAQAGRGKSIHSPSANDLGGAAQKLLTERR